VHRELANNSKDRWFLLHATYSQLKNGKPVYEDHHNYGRAVAPISIGEVTLAKSRDQPVGSGDDRKETCHPMPVQKLRKSPRNLKES